MKDFRTLLRKTLLGGRSVNIAGLGYFYLSAQSKGTETAEEFTIANISGLRVCFRANSDIRLFTGTTTHSDGLKFKDLDHINDSGSIGDGSDDGGTPDPDDGSGGNGEAPDPADTWTNAQKRVLYQIIMDLQREYNILQVLGHRDTSPDLNGDGVIEPHEYVKVCPCFDVREFLRNGRELLFVLLVVLVMLVSLSGCRSKKEVVNRESDVRVDSSLNSSSAKSLVKNEVVSEKDSEVVEEHIEQVVFVFPVDTLGVKAGMVVKTVVDRKNVNEKQLLQEVNLQSVSLSDMNAKTEIHKTGVEKTTNG